MLSIIALVIGIAIIALGFLARMGNQLLVKYDPEKIGDLYSLRRYIGKNLFLLGFIGIVAGLAGVAAEEDNILVFLAYLGFAAFFVYLIRVGAKVFEKKA